MPKMQNITKDQIVSCNTKEDLVKLLNDHHIDGRQMQDGDHALIVFSDGEICSTKAGDLFLKRGMHQLEGGVLRKSQRMTGLLWQTSGFDAVTLQNVSHGTLVNKIKSLFHSDEEEKLKLEAGNKIDINFLQPIKISGGWQLEDSPEIMKLYFWGSESQWRPGTQHNSGRESKFITYMTRDANTAIKIQLLGYGRIKEMDTDRKDPSYIIQAVELY